MVIDEEELRVLNAKLPADARCDVDLAGRANLAMLQGDVKGAEALAQAALVLDPCDALALRVAGEIAMRRGDMTLALAAYERAILENPSDWRSARALATIHRDSGRPERASGIMAMLAADPSVPGEALR